MHDDPALCLGLSLGISLELNQMEAVKGNVELGRLREGGRYMNYEAKAASTFYPFKGCRYPTYSAESHLICTTHNNGEECFNTE